MEIIDFIKKSGYSDGKTTVPVIHLHEIGYQDTKIGKIVEDFKYTDITELPPSLNVKKLNLINDIEIITDFWGISHLENARKTTGLDGPIMYLTAHELETLKEQMRRELSLS